MGVVRRLFVKFPKDRNDERTTFGTPSVTRGLGLRIFLVSIDLDLVYYDVQCISNFRCGNCVKSFSGASNLGRDS